MSALLPSTSLLRTAKQLAVAIAFLIGVFAAAGGLAAQDVTLMEAPEAHEKALKGEIVLIDIRTPEEWKQTGVPASAHAISMHQNAQTFISELLNAAAGDSEKPIAVICRTGSRSTALAAPLAKAGFPNVINVAEGVVGGPRGPGWTKRGLPLRQWSPDDRGPQLAAQ